MSRLARALARLLPAGRRDWAEAIWAEAGPAKASAVRAWQGLAAGLVTGGVGALFVTAAGAGTTALLIRSAGFRGWIYHGQHLTASATYGRELYASQFVMGHAAVCVIFPVIALLMAMAGAGYANVAGARPGDDPPSLVLRP